MSIFMRCLLLLAVPLAASPAVYASAAPASPAQLIVEDNGGYFSQKAIDEAKAIVAKSVGTGDRQVHVQTYAALSPQEAAELKKTADKDKSDFWRTWSNGKIKGDHGVVILMVREQRHVEIRVDGQIRESGFSGSNEKGVYDAMAAELRKMGKIDSPDEQRPFNDAALLAGADYLKSNLPTAIAQKPGAKHGTEHKAANAGEGSGIMKWVCIGIAVLAGIWLVTGLMRAFSGGGGGGPGGMGGGGGGGFGSSLLGGLFGAMAGMWLYNNLLGGNTSSAWGDTGGGDTGDTGGGDVGGAGDFSGDQGSGGDYGGGGGDTGGGGGDFGGGGGDY